MDEKVLEKVKKLLALANSPEPHEAALAMQRARELMEQYKISSDHIEAASLDHALVKRGRKVFKQYDLVLVTLIQDVFSVKIIIHDFIYFLIIGDEVNVELAKYAITVTARQLEKDRTVFVESLNKRLKRHTKVKQGDDFAYGWTCAVRSNLRHLTSNFSQERFDAWWKIKNMGELGTVEAKKTPGKLHDRGFKAGFESGKKVQLQKPMRGAAESQKLGSATLQLEGI